MAKIQNCVKKINIKLVIQNTHKLTVTLKQKKSLKLRLFLIGNNILR